jgi:hypothetical protein
VIRYQVPDVHLPSCGLVEGIELDPLDQHVSIVIGLGPCTFLTNISIDICTFN